jgi:hypothetical protein
LTTIYHAPGALIQISQNGGRLGYTGPARVLENNGHYLKVKVDGIAEHLVIWQYEVVGPIGPHINVPWQDQDGANTAIPVFVDRNLERLLCACYALLQDAPISLEDIVAAARPCFPKEVS